MNASRSTIGPSGRRLSPLGSLRASSRKMRLTSSALVGRATRHTMSAIDPTGPSNLPRYSGSARVVAFAAPVVDGTRLAAAARPRRRSLFVAGRRAPGSPCTRGSW